MIRAVYGGRYESCAHDWLRRPATRWTRYTSTIIVALACILGGSLSLQPAIWNDSTAFIASAVHSRADGVLRVQSGVNVGYVWVIATVLSVAGSFKFLILLQHCAWILTVTVCFVTVVRVAEATNGWLLFFVSTFVWLAVYPGLQLYNNIVLAESMYSCAVCAGACCLIAAWSASTTRSAAMPAMMAIVAATAAALLKAQGILPAMVLAMLVLWVAVRHGRITAMAAALAVVVAMFVVLQGQRLRSTSSDQTSVLFGPKTLFCMHLNAAVESIQVHQQAQQAFGRFAPSVLARLREDIQAPVGNYPTLGFDGDVCQFDTQLDKMAMAAGGMTPASLAAWYSGAFVAAVRESPGIYARKVFAQLLYGLRMAMPPHGIGAEISGVADRHADALATVKASGLGDAGLSLNEAIPSPIVGRLSRGAVVAYRAVSLLVAASLVLAVLGVGMHRWRERRGGAYAALAALVWWAQIGGVALTHSLDVWRYIAPVVPLGVVAFALVVWFSVSIAVSPRAPLSEVLEQAPQ